MFFHDIGACNLSFSLYKEFFGINLATPVMKVFPLEIPLLVFFNKHSKKKTLFFFIVQDTFLFTIYRTKDLILQTISKNCNLTTELR